MNNMLTLDDAVQYAEEYPFGSVQSILACEIRRLRDEVNSLTGSLDRAENALQNLMSYLSVNGSWTDVSPCEAEQRIRDGIDILVRPAVPAEWWEFVESVPDYLSNYLDKHDHYGPVLLKEQARALLQSAEVRHD